MTLRQVDDIYVCDFETLVNPDYTYVWSWGIKGIFHGYEYVGSTIDEFMGWLRGVKKGFFHNLGFDGAFIIDWLFRQGFSYSETPSAKSFSVLRANTTLYSIDIYWTYQSKKKFSRTRLMDSYKKLPFKVERIAKAWKLPMLKGSIDYKEHREYGHIATDEEREYILNDVRIVAAALHTQLDEGFDSMTIGSDALKSFHKTHSARALQQLIPSLDLSVDAYLRKAYRGGFTYVNPKYQGVDIEEGIVFDVNSLYPSVMYNCKMPYGKPEYYEGRYVPDPIYDVFIAHVQMVFDLKPNHIPCIQLKRSRFFRDNEYVETSSGQIVDMYVSSVDLALIFDHYNVSAIEYIDGYKFKSCTGAFNKYIDGWMEVKVREKGAKRENAKLFLNNLYGKLATNPIKQGKIPFFDVSKDVVRYQDDEERETDPIYIPMGVFVTAWARDLTIRSCQKEYDRFIYADTDSMHLTGVSMPESIDVHDSRLGAWKHETTFRRGRYIRAKSYIELVEKERVQVNANSDGWKRVGYRDISYRLPGVQRIGRRLGFYGLKVTCAGMQASQHKYVTWANFKQGAIYQGKLRPKVVPGGVVLVDTTFQIS